MNKKDMPVLRPVPIQTKNKSFFVSLWVWAFSVRKWELTQDWFYPLSDATIIVVPKGYVFDGASIPRPLWWFLSPTGLLLVPALIHDYAYEYDLLLRQNKSGEVQNIMEGAGKSYWDALFRDIATQVNGMVPINYIAWIALRLFGFFYWFYYRLRGND